MPPVAGTVGIAVNLLIVGHNGGLPIVARGVQPLANFSNAGADGFSVPPCSAYDFLHRRATVAATHRIDQANAAIAAEQLVWRLARIGCAANGIPVQAATGACDEQVF